MKLKFKNADGEILSVGHMPDLQAGPGETVENYSGDIPGDISLYRRTGPGKIELRPQQEIDQIKDERKNLTPGKFMQKFNNKFPNATDAEKYLAKSISQLAGGIKEKAID